MKKLLVPTLALALAASSVTAADTATANKQPLVTKSSTLVGADPITTLIVLIFVLLTAFPAPVLGSGAQ